MKNINFSVILSVSYREVQVCRASKITCTLILEGVEALHRYCRKINNCVFNELIFSHEPLHTYNLIFYFRVVQY